LITNVADINVQNQDEATSLMLVADCEYLNVVKYLQDKEPEYS